MKRCGSWTLQKNLSLHTFPPSSSFHGVLPKNTPPASKRHMLALVHALAMHTRNYKKKDAKLKVWNAHNTNWLTHCFHFCCASYTLYCRHRFSALINLSCKLLNCSPLSIAICKLNKCIKAKDSDAVFFLLINWPNSINITQIGYSTFAKRFRRSNNAKAKQATK